MTRSDTPEGFPDFYTELGVITVYEGHGMKLVVDLPDQLVGRIKDAVETGGYDDAREFVTTAIENQLKLEESDEASGSFKTLDEAIHEFGQSDTQIDSDSREEAKPHPTPESGLGRREYRSVVPSEPPELGRVSDGPLWGQYNRILPVKFVVRRLANVLEEQAGENIDEATTTHLGEFSSDVAWEARNFGQELKRVDERRSRGRGEKLSAGFPTGEKTEKSIDRFESHFVGYADRNGNLTGAPATLRFINIFENDGHEVGITEHGLEFADIVNPVLDKDSGADEPLSHEEREFYMSHVREVLPAEFEAMIHTANSVHKGDNRPTSLSERVAELNEDWSDAQASTNRSGLVSRMYELGLVDRHRVGQRGVGYDLTDKGHEFLQAHMEK